jgi:heterogeneous nuclear ribonucleoprotein G
MSELRLFVGGIHYDADEADLQMLFESPSVHVTDAVIVRDKLQNNRSKGFGFVTIETKRTLRDVIEEYHLSKIKGRQVTVNAAKEKVPHDRKEVRTQ